jgi:phosphatidylglycerol:prolipoprotein diacylglycerol transferase
MNHLLSITWNPSKGFDIGPILLHYYSLLFMMAFIAGWYITKKIFEREGESIEKLDKLFIYTIVAIFLGARLGHVFFYDWNYFKQHPAEILLPFKFSPFEFTGFTGLASHGAAIAVIIAVVIYSKKIIHRPVLWVLDRIAPSIASGGILVRVGNFMNSEILGSETSPSLATAVRFVRGENNLGEQRAIALTGEQNIDKAYKLIEHDSRFANTLAMIPYRHPAQLYEAICYIFVFLAVFYMYWKTPARNYHGLIFGVFLVLLWTVRFMVEFVKESQGGFEEQLHVFSTGQWLSIPFILAGLYLIFTSKKRVETL